MRVFIEILDGTFKVERFKQKVLINGTEKEYTFDAIFKESTEEAKEGETPEAQVSPLADAQQIDFNEKPNACLEMIECFKRRFEEIKNEKNLSQCLDLPAMVEELISSIKKKLQDVENLEQPLSSKNHLMEYRTEVPDHFK